MLPTYWFVAEVNPKNAGYRVRTMPIAAEMRAQGIEVELRAILQMPTLVKEVCEKAAVVIVSKPSDTVTHLCLRHFSSQGITVVVDLFDNYFSWSAALEQKHLHWQWMRGLQTASLVMSSSSYLGHVIQSLTDKPVVEVGDEICRPRGNLCESPAFVSKWSGGGTDLEVLWFGISGNPYYLAGLEDIARAGSVLRAIASRLPSRSLRLTLCTNRVPAVEAVLAGLRALQIDARFVEWSEDGCDELLRRSHVVALPTNLSGFSLGKTHNRCSDALRHGCLVLASPNGPYIGVEGAVIDEPDLLATVVQHASPQGVAQLIDASFTELSRRHDLRGDVSRLKVALAKARQKVQSRTIGHEPRVLITARVRADVPKFSRTVGYLVAGFADHSLQLNYDFFQESLLRSAGVPTITLSPRAWTVVQLKLSHDVSVDMQDFDDRIECRVDGWRIELLRSSKAVVVVEGFDADLLESLERAQRQGRGTTASELANWHEPHVETMTRILARLGFREIDLAAEEDGGWEAFAAYGDPALERIAQRLRANWIRYDGNELAWGRPAGMAV